MKRMFMCERKVDGQCLATWGQCEHAKRHQPMDHMPDGSGRCTNYGECPRRREAARCVPLEV